MTDDKTKVVSPTNADIQVGDSVRVVIQGEGSKGDPLAYISGTMTIIHSDDDDVNLEFGDTIQVTIADTRQNQYHAVYTEDE